MLLSLLYKFLRSIIIIDHWYCRGIGSAVVAVGTNQVFLATGPESLLNASPEDIDYVVLPVNSVRPEGKGCFQPDRDFSTRQTSSISSFKLPASIKSRLAVRKKPVMKWKPYRRPVGLRTGTEDDTPDDTMGEGCYEEECAFMWRTIEEDTESCKQFPVTTDNCKESTKMSSELDNVPTDHRVFSKYAETKSRTFNKTVHTESDIIFYRPKCPSSSIRRHASRRGRYKPRVGSWVESGLHHSSLPQLPCRACGLPSSSPRVVRSLSENSVFIEAVAQCLRNNSLESLNRYGYKARGKNRRKSISSTHTSGL